MARWCCDPLKHQAGSVVKRLVERLAFKAGLMAPEALMAVVLGANRTFDQIVPKKRLEYFADWMACVALCQGCVRLAS